METVKEIVKKVFKVGPNDLNPEEFKVTHYHCIAPHGVKFEDLMEPSAWAHVSSKLSPGTRIHVVADDNSYIGELFVCSVGSQWANVRQVSYNDFSGAQAAQESSEFEAVWISNSVQWAVRRKSDKALIEKNLPNEASAQAKLALHIAETRKAG